MNVYLFVKTEDNRPYVQTYYTEKRAREAMLTEYHEEKELMKDHIVESFYPKSGEVYHLSLTFSNGKRFSYDIITIMV